MPRICENIFYFDKPSRKRLGTTGVMIDENKVLLKNTEAKFDRFLDCQMIMAGDFFSPEQQSVLAPFVYAKRGSGVFFFGGYEEAERKQLIFMPGYTGVTDEAGALDYFREYSEDAPQRVLDCKVSEHSRKKPGHRDYLGALMGEGIKREVIGDILVTPSGAQIIVNARMAEYLKREFTKAGNVSLTTEIKHVWELDTGEIKTELLRLNVASPRLDNVVSEVFGLSRKDAVTAISRGIVFVDGTETMKPDYRLKEDQKLVLRGKGKAIYLGQTGVSKKGKAYIEVEKYLS